VRAHPGRHCRPLDSVIKKSAALVLLFSFVLLSAAPHASAGTIGVETREYTGVHLGASPLAEAATRTPDPAAQGITSGAPAPTSGSTVTVAVTINPYRVVEDTSAGITFDRFVPVRSAAYSNGSYVYGRWTNTRIDARFSGTRIIWIGPKQPNYGKADVYIDNVKLATVDCYAPPAQATSVATIWRSPELAPGAHIISIRLTGARNPASSGNIVVIDRLVLPGAAGGVTGTRVNETAGLFSGLWITCANTTYTGGTYRYSRWPSAKYTLAFTGTRIAWVGPRTRDYGKAAIYIDGSYVTTLSQFGLMGWRYRVWESAVLPRGEHTLEIRVLGTKQADSTSANIVVDCFDITP